MASRLAGGTKITIDPRVGLRLVSRVLTLLERVRVVSRVVVQ